MSDTLLPRARLRDVLRRRAPVIGTRLAVDATRGWISPIEARCALGIPYDDLVNAESEYLRKRTRLSDISLVLRTVFARALEPGDAAEPVRRPKIVSAAVDNLTIDAAIGAIFAEPTRPGARMIHFVHPHALNIAARDATLAQQLAQADLVLPDGVGIRIAARILGIRMLHNINGTDLWPHVCREAATRGVPIALIGAAPGVAEASAQRIVDAHPQLSIVLVSHGYLGETDSRDVAARLGNLGRCIAFVGMGTPRQEAWAWKYLADVSGLTVITVGGLLDFISGRVRRAPLAWREIGLEWAFRLLQEPRRFSRRYLLGNPAFLLRVVRQRFAAP